MLGKEIGSEYWDIPTTSTRNTLFCPETKWFVSGRAAFDFILKNAIIEHNIKTIAIPSWCCDTMIEPIIKNGIDYKFYPVIYADNKLQIDYNIEADAILDLSYFGYKRDHICHFDGVIIKDLTHSVFSNEELNADYYFGSLRKWAGIKTGGFAYAKKRFAEDSHSKICEEYVELRKEAMIQKNNYILGLSDSKDYLRVFEQAETMLENLYDFGSPIEDIEAIQHLDLELIRNKRRENALFVINELSHFSMFKKLGENDCPLFVPIYVDNGKRDLLRKELINNKIYCPIHWPLTPLHTISDDEKKIYDSELSLICDQRYSVSDMERMCKIVKGVLC